MDNNQLNNIPAQESTEQRIFDAARDVFVQKGLDGAKMQEIADKAGINKALLHYYFRTKEKLFEEVAKFVMSKALPIIKKTLESDLPLEEKLETFIDFYIDLISKNTFVPLFLISEMNKRPQHFIEYILPKERPEPAVFFRQVEKEVALGHIRPVLPQHLIVHVISLCVFPFVARPMMQVVLGMPSEEMQQFLIERKTAVKQFVKAALKPV